MEKKKLVDEELNEVSGGVLASANYAILNKSEKLSVNNAIMDDNTGGDIRLMGGEVRSINGGFGSGKVEKKEIAGGKTVELA